MIYESYCLTAPKRLVARWEAERRERGLSEAAGGAGDATWGPVQPRQAGSGIQLPWKPAGTRWGRWTMAWGSPQMSWALSTYRSEVLVPAWCTRVRTQPSPS